MLFALGSASFAAAGEVEVKASLEPRTLAAGEVAELSFEAHGGMFDHVQFRPEFELENFEVVAGPMQSQGISIVNGATSRSFRLSWRLRALAEGTAAVRAVAADFGGRRAELPNLEARVRAAPEGGGPSIGGGLRSRPRRGAEPQVFLLAEATPLHPWTGQQVTYSLWIYTQVRVSSLSLAEPPAFPGFWVSEVAVPDDADGEAVEVDGQLFLRKLLLRRALFPLHPGRYELDPAEVSLLVSAPAADLFNPFFARPERLTRRSRTIVVDARPLPTPPAEPAALAAFDGLVGDVSLTARLEPRELKVGEAAALDLSLSGDGNLAGARAPRLAAPPGLRALAAAGAADSTVDGARVGGTRRWSYALVPERAGVFRLPPIEVPYFDPAAGEYRLAAAGPLELLARAGDPAAAGAGTAAGGPVEPHPIRSAALPAARGPRWPALLPWLFALPWGVALVVALARRRTAAARRSDGTGSFAERLAAAAEEERARSAAAAIEEAWRELLAERWGVPAETPAARWRERVTEAGADPEAAADLEALAGDLHYLRYAPQLSAVAALRGELIDRSRRLEPRLR